MDIVIPTIAKDVSTILSYSTILFELLPISRVVIIGDESVETLVRNADDRIFFINEKTIVKLHEVKKWIFKYAGEKYIYRSGWYLQQFIKMAYAQKCKDEYYLLWDSDTIPLKKVSFFNDDNIPFFDLKKEYNISYFQTIRNLLGLNKQISESFISEHMLIKTSIMKELISKIEERDLSKSKCYAEIIIEEASKSNSFDVGYSEFETYGTFVSYYYPQAYDMRKWKSMRYGSFFFKNTFQMNHLDTKWLARNYDAISFERNQHYSVFGNIVSQNFVKKIFPSTVLEIMAFIERGKQKIKTAISSNNSRMHRVFKF